MYCSVYYSCAIGVILAFEEAKKDLIYLLLKAIFPKSDNE
jgi:hypothetical protein